MDDQYDEFKVRDSKKSNEHRNSQTTFQEMESAVQRLKQLFVARMATQTRKRRKRRAKRESDYKCQKDSAIRYTYSWCFPSLPLLQLATRLTCLHSVGASNSRPVLLEASICIVAQRACEWDEIAVGGTDAACRVPCCVSEYLASVCSLSNCLLTIINHLY